MASLAIAVAGAGLGQVAFGLPQLGFLVGSVVGTLLFPPPGQDTVTEGPRLGDLSVTSSAYGSTIPLGYGTVRMGGNVIWSSGIREVEQRRTSGGKGSLGGPKQTQITYTYFCDLAIAFAATEASDIVRIWADGKLILDRSGTRNYRLSGLKFRFYKGTETQLPDSIIEADKGSGQVPGHRGLCYIVFDDLPLESFGRRIPNITAEIAFKSVTANTSDGGSALGSTLGYQSDTIAVDYRRRRLYLQRTDDEVLSVLNLDTLDEIRRKDFGDSSELGITAALHAGHFTGSLYHSVGFSNNQTIVKRNPETLEIESQFSGGGISTSNSPSGFGASWRLCEGQVLDPMGGARHFLCQTALASDALGLLDADTMEYIWHNNSAAPDEIAGISTSMQSTFGETAFWILVRAGGNGTATLFKLTVQHDARYDALLGGTVGVELTTAASLDASIWNNEGDGYIDGPAIDLRDGGLVFVKDLSGAAQVFKWIEGQGVVWSTKVSGINGISRSVNKSRSWASNSLINDGRVAWNDGTNAVLIDTYDGTVLDGPVTEGSLGVALDNADGCVWDGSTDGLLAMGSKSGSTSGAVRLFLDKVTGVGVGLDSIVEDLASRAGYDISEDLVTTSLNDTVQGYMIGKQMTYRQAIEPLAMAFMFEAVESDDKIKFVKRGGSPVKTINQSDLVEIGDNGEVLPEQRTQEVELPERLNVIFLDKDSDYQQNSLSSKRVRQPIPTIRSRVEQSVTLPIVMTPDYAKQVSEILLFSAWNERTGFKFKLPQEFLLLDPTDIVNVNLDSGASLEVRIGSSIVDPDFSINFEGVSETAVTFSSTASGQGADGVPQKLPPSPVATRLFLPNTPLLRDIDDTSGIASRIYFAMSGYEEGWASGSLLQSQDAGTTYTEISRALAPIDWGVVAEALPDTETPFQTDEDTTLTVFMQVGELNSVTQTQFLNDTNVALIGSPTTDIWEVVGFRDVTEVAPGQYTVQGLLRGKRGTDVFVGDHATNEFFLPLTSDTIFAFLLPLAQRNVSLSYKGVGSAEIEEDVSPQAFTGKAYDLMPYAPVHLDAVADGGSNIDLSWVRRTRLGGEFNDGTGTVPLGETSQLYEVDIFDGSGTTVLRTLGSGGTLSTPSVQYDNADIITDFGSVPATLTFEVFQISSVVGRGFGRKVTITL